MRKRLSDTAALTRERPQEFSTSVFCRKIDNGYVKHESGMRNGNYYSKEYFVESPGKDAEVSSLRDAIKTCEGK